MTYFRIRLLIILLSALLLSDVAYSQVFILYGRIVDEHKKGIPGCGVEDTLNHDGVLTDAHGYFSIPFLPDSTKALKFYGLGYQSRMIPTDELIRYKNDTLVVALTAENYNLNAVKVTGKKEKMKQRVLGVRRQKQVGHYYGDFGDEFAICLQADPDNREGYLKEVFIYITDDGAPASNFKVNVYKKDTAKLAPGVNLTGGIIAHGTKGNEWIRVDVSEKRIPIMGGVFVGVEWIAEGNTDEIFTFDPSVTWQWRRGGFKIPGSPILANGFPSEAGFRAQVMGSTWDYGRINRTFEKYKDNDKWGYLDMAAPKRVDMFHRGHWWNPMIYCTYTYSKK